VQLQEQCQPIAIRIAIATKTEPSPIPAVGQNNAKSIIALAKQGGHIIGLVLQAMIIAGPAGRELVIAYPLLEMEAVEPPTSDTNRLLSIHFMQTVDLFASLHISLIDLGDFRLDFNSPSPGSSDTHG
jgi:hypothetical protein